MKTYPTHQEAKIKHPDFNVYKYSGGYVSAISVPQTTAHPNDRGFFKCDPKKECISVYDFFESGKVFHEDDVYMQADGRVVIVRIPELCNARNDGADIVSFVLKAKELDGGALPVSIGGLRFTPKSKIRVDHVKVEESIFDLKEEYCSGSLKSNCGTNDNPKFETIMAIADLAHHLLRNNVHRVVEVEVSEQDEFTDALLEIGADCTSFTQLARTLYQSGRFKLVEGA